MGPGQRLGRLEPARHDVTLVATKKKPFDEYVKGLDLDSSRGDWRSFEPTRELFEPFLDEAVGGFDAILGQLVTLAATSV